LALIGKLLNPDMQLAGNPKQIPQVEIGFWDAA